MKTLAVEVLVVGAGPAGLAAAGAAATAGCQIGLVDDNPFAGGQIWRQAAQASVKPEAARWVTRARRPNVHLLTNTRIIAAPRTGELLAGCAEEPIALCYDRLILATGARERFLPFPGWTLPGVFGAGGLQALVKGGLPIAGKRVVVAGSGPLLPAVAAYLRAAGAHVPLVAEQASLLRLAGFAVPVAGDAHKLREAAGYGWTLRRTRFRTSSWVVRARGAGRVEAVDMHTSAGDWCIPCEYLACGFGLVPNLELPALLGCRITGTGVWTNAWQQTSVPEIYCAGESTGIGGLDSALVEGQIAGLAATGQWGEARASFQRRGRARRFARSLDRAFALRRELTSLPADGTIVCRCEDVTYGELRRHESWRSAKLQTRCGMGPCQGRICGTAATWLFGWTTDRPRPPISPVLLGNLYHVEDAVEPVGRT